MLVCKDNIILMSVSVPDNEIVCYSVDNAISNAKVTGASPPPPLKKVGARAPPTSDACEFVMAACSEETKQ